MLLVGHLPTCRSNFWLQKKSEIDPPLKTLNYIPETDMRPDWLCLEHELLLKMASSAVCVGQWERTFRKDTEKNSSPACTHLLWSSLAHRCPRPAQNIKESSRNLSWNPEYGNRGAIHFPSQRLKLSVGWFQVTSLRNAGARCSCRILKKRRYPSVRVHLHSGLYAFLEQKGALLTWAPLPRCFPWNKRHKTWGSLDPYSSSSKSALQKDSN